LTVGCDRIASRNRRPLAGVVPLAPGPAGWIGDLLKLVGSLLVLSALALASPAFAQDAPPAPAASAVEEDFAKLKATLEEFQKTKRRELLDKAYTEAGQFLDRHAEKANAEQLQQAAGVWMQLSFMRDETAGVKKRIEQLRAIKELPAPVAEMCTKAEEALKQKEAMEAAKANIQPGKQAPNWTGTDVMDGAQASLEGLKGKIVLMDFWATWCGPCVQLMKRELAPLYEKYKDDPKFVLVGIGLPWRGETAAKEKEFAEKSGYHWKKVFDASGNAGTSYGVEGIPFLCLVDEEGKILVVGNGGSVIGEVKKILSERLGAGKPPVETPPPGK
jgi:thiol-disulfide isomerase/thioredoxin